MNYSILKPRQGYLILKDVETKNESKFKRSGESESRAYARVIALSDSHDGSLSIGQLVCYNEYEGQELFKYGPIDEDHIIVIKESDILLTIKEDESK